LSYVFSPTPRKFLAANLVKFGAVLKAAGIPISIGEILDAGTALNAIPILDKFAFYFALRSTLVKDPDKYVLYDLLFRQFWSVESLGYEPREPGSSEKSKKQRENESPDIVFADMNEADPQSQRKTNAKNLAIYSPASRSTQRKFRPHFPPEKIGKTKRLVRRFKRRFATLEGRRIIVSKGGQIDLGRSIRRSVRSGGSAILLSRSAKKITRSKIIALADVSGSMDEQSEEIYLLLYLLKNISSKTELFIFSTELVRLTNLFTFNSFRKTAERIAGRVHIWGSGTRIGECFQEFLRKYGTLIDKDSTIVIISDGWDLGPPNILNDSMYLMRYRSGRIIWLNPYVKNKGYRPSCVGMKTALPYVDVFTSPDVFVNRQAFERYFGREISPWISRKPAPAKKSVPA
jgi:uncharacterized protein